MRASPTRAHRENPAGLSLDKRSDRRMCFAVHHRLLLPVDQNLVESIRIRSGDRLPGGALRSFERVCLHQVLLPRSTTMQASPVPLPGATTRGRRSRTAVIASVVTVLTTLLATGLTWWAPASAATTPLVGAASGRCLDVKGTSQANGAAVNIWDCNGQDNQALDFTSAGELRVYGNKCLDVNGRGTADGTAVIIWSCNGQANQKWRQNTDGSITACGRACASTCPAAAPPTAPRSPVDLQRRSNQKWSTGASRARRGHPTPPRPARVRVTSTPRAARRAWPRTAPRARSTAPTAATFTRSGAPRTTRPGTSAS